MAKHGGKSSAMTAHHRSYTEAPYVLYCRLLQCEQITGSANAAAAAARLSQPLAVLAPAPRTQALCTATPSWRRSSSSRAGPASAGHSVSSRPPAALLSWLGFACGPETSSAGVAALT